MKTLAKESMKLLPGLNICKKTVEFITIVGGQQQIKAANALDLDCPYCKGKEHYTCTKDPSSGDSRKVWICANLSCEVNENPKYPTNQ